MTFSTGIGLGGPTKETLTMRKLTIGLLLVAACGSPTVAATPEPTVAPTTTTTTTTEPEATYEQLVDEMAETICEGFETLYLPEMVEAIQGTLGGSEVDSLTIVAIAIAGWCPDETDQFIWELDEFYDAATADGVLDNLEEAFS